MLGAVLPGALLTGFIVTRTLEDNRKVLENRLADTARVDAAALDREFNGTIRVLQTLAESPSLDAGDLKTSGRKRSEPHGPSRAGTRWSC